MIINVKAVDNTTLDLNGYTMPSGLPCGPGYLVAVVYFTSNGSYSEYISQQININCAVPVEIRFVFTLTCFYLNAKDIFLPLMIL